MKKYLCLNLVILGLLSSCMPKSPSSSSGSSSTNSSPVSGNGGGLTGTTPTASPTYTVPPTYTNNYCDDPIGDCTGQFPVLQFTGIKKRGMPYNGGPDSFPGTAWDSAYEGLGSSASLTTDGRLKIKIKVNSRPARLDCGIASGSYNPYAYTKMRFEVTVRRSGDTNPFYTKAVDPVSVGSTSDVIDVPVSQYPSASPYIIRVAKAKSDSYCLWQSASSWNNCSSNPACKCPVEESDPTNCWSVDLQIVTSTTNNFR